MKNHFEMTAWSALVLAADRHENDPVAVDAGVPCKALAPVAGVPMLQRVLDAISASDRIRRITLVGPPRKWLQELPDISRRIDSNSLGWIEPAPSPSASAWQGLQELPEHQPVLVTTTDHALLSTRMIDYFLDHAERSGCDFVVGLARLETVQAGFPGSRRTATRLRGGPYCGCNLFAVNTPRGRELTAFWRRVEEQRKKPWRVIVGALGWRAVLSYFAGRLTLEQALERLSQRLGLRLGAVVLPFAEAAVDVDTPADRQLVERVLAARQG